VDTVGRRCFVIEGIVGFNESLGRACVDTEVVAGRCEEREWIGGGETLRFLGCAETRFLGSAETRFLGSAETRCWGCAGQAPVGDTVNVY
jgi:hypothetical protein